MTSEPLDKDLVERLAGNLGEITLYAAGLMITESPDAAPSKTADPPSGGLRSSLSLAPDKGSGGIVIGQNKQGVTVEGDQQELRPTFTVASYLRTQFRYDTDQLAADVASLRAAGVPEQ